jgi:hypothetical protein
MRPRRGNSAVRRTTILVLALGAVVAFTWANAAGPAQVVRLQGYVVDSWCGKSNANPEGKECVVACAKKGAKLLFYTEKGESYTLSDRDEALKHVGRPMEIIGTVQDGVLKVGRWNEVPKKATEEDSPS